jgi:hypothetical protein
MASGGSASALSKTITQVSHGFIVGDIVRISAGTYVKSLADAPANAEVSGIVTEVTDTDNFTLTQSGYITGLSGLTSSEAYFLSPTVAGEMTIVGPSTIGQVSKPIFFSDSTTSGWFDIYRGVEVVGANSFLEIANNLSDLDNAATARTNLGVEIGVDVQAHSINLDNLPNITVSITAPTSPAVGDLWVDIN